MTKYYYDPTNNRGYIPGRYVNKVVFLLITFFLGHFGIQYFYVGKNFKGLLLYRPQKVRPKNLTFWRSVFLWLNIILNLKRKSY